MNKDLFMEIREQFPNPYIVNEYYKIILPNLKGTLYARITQARTIHLLQIQQKQDKIKLSRYRFNKQFDLLFLSDYILTEEKDGDVYIKYKNMY